MPGRFSPMRLDSSGGSAPEAWTAPATQFQVRHLLLHQDTWGSSRANLLVKQSGGCPPSRGPAVHGAAPCSVLPASHQQHPVNGISSSSGASSRHAQSADLLSVESTTQREGREERERGEASHARKWMLPSRETQAKNSNLRRWVGGGGGQLGLKGTEELGLSLHQDPQAGG